MVEKYESVGSIIPNWMESHNPIMFQTFSNHQSDIHKHISTTNHPSVRLVKQLRYRKPPIAPNCFRTSLRHASRASAIVV